MISEVVNFYSYVKSDTYMLNLVLIEYLFCQLIANLIIMKIGYKACEFIKNFTIIKGYYKWRLWMANQSFF